MPSSMPRLAACFLVQFDNRKGYTLTWHRAKDNLDLEGTIEFKCLPSGLHNVQEDLVYFIHEGYTGASAFQSAEASEAERNARFVSVGVLASGEDAWTYAAELQELASIASSGEDVVAQLEEFWSSKSSGEKLMVPGAVMSQRNHELSQSAGSMLKDFGPLLIPLYKACLLRQRVLIIGQPPMLLLCDFVHLLSSMSILPASANVEEHVKQLQAVYTIGVHDITTLSSTTSWQGIFASSSLPHTGYIACTSDSLLATKPQLSDVRLTLPTSSDASTSSMWPTLTGTNPGTPTENLPIKATQRDLARWQLLTQYILKSSTSPAPSSPASEHSDDENDRALLLPTSDDSPSISSATAPPKSRDTTTTVEPPSWSSTLTRFSATTTLLAEAASDNDEVCLHSAADAVDALEDADADANDGLRSANMLKCFFREQTKRIFNILTERCAIHSQQDEGGYRDAPEDEDETAPLRPDTTSSTAGESGEVVKISRGDMVNIGLDVFSTSDAAFVTELARLYFGRRVEVEGVGVEVCGVRIY